MVNITLPEFGPAPDPSDLETFEERVDDYMAKLPLFAAEFNKFVERYNGGWKLIITADQSELSKTRK